MLLHGVLVEAFGYLKGPTDIYTRYKERDNEGLQAFAIQQMGRRRQPENDEGSQRQKVPSP